MINIICGLPASGKSTFANSLASTVYDFDSWIVNRMGCPFKKAMELFMGYNPKRFYNEYINLALEHENASIVDVLATPEEREYVLSKCKQKKYTIHAWWVETPLETIIKRNRKRNSPVDESIIMNMYRAAVHPSKNEGFNYVTIVRGF